jgi:hypothetical protein
MTPLRIALFASIFTSTTLSLAADLPRSVPRSNVVVCQPNTRCIHKTIFGYDYKMLSTDRFAVMVSLSSQGRYTRADVSITSFTPTPTELSPEVFRIESLTPRSKVFRYVPPSQLENIPAPTRATRITAPDDPEPPANPNPEFRQISQISQLSRRAAAEKRAAQEALEFYAATADLKPIILPPREAVGGRVYFERDQRTKHQQVNVVLRIAGTVFRFPYVINPDASESEPISPPSPPPNALAMNESSR